MSSRLDEELHHQNSLKLHRLERGIDCHKQEVAVLPCLKQQYLSCTNDLVSEPPTL